MRLLTVTLVFKIGMTAVFWAAPLLLFPTSWLVCLGLPAGGPLMPFVRLLGVAYASLLVGYVDGLRRARRGAYPRETVWTGIASNGGACIVLCAAALADSWSTWETPARWLMWMSLVATGAIAVALIGCARAWRPPAESA